MTDHVVADEDLFWVVVNHEGQYSVWPSFKAVPAGWEAIGEPAGHSDCLERIGLLWTDMRPASIR